VRSASAIAAELQSVLAGALDAAAPAASAPAPPPAGAAGAAAP
jgi:hypothetical protein